MRQTQIQRRAQKRGGNDDTPDEIVVTEVSAHAAKASGDAQAVLDKINSEV